MSSLRTTHAPAALPSAGRESSLRLLAVVGLVLLGTALTVRAFLESASVAHGATQESVEPPSTQYMSEVESYWTTTFLWSGDGLGALPAQGDMAPRGLTPRRTLRRESRAESQG